MKENSYFFRLEGVDEGLTSLYLHYFRELKQCLYIVNTVCSKAWCMKLWYRFRHSPSKGVQLLMRVEYHKMRKPSKNTVLNIVRTLGMNQDKRKQCINDF